MEWNHSQIHSLYSIKKCGMISSYIVVAYTVLVANPITLTQL